VSAPEGTERCCICATRAPIACGVCLGVSQLDTDVTWFVRRMNALHATVAELRAQLEARTPAPMLAEAGPDELAARFRAQEPTRWDDVQTNDVRNLLTVIDLLRVELGAARAVREELDKTKTALAGVLAKWSGQDDRTVRSCAAELAHVLQEV